MFSKFNKNSRQSAFKSNASASDLDKNFKQFCDQKSVKLEKEMNEKIEKEMKDIAQKETSFSSRVKSVRPLPVKKKFEEGWCYLKKNKKTGHTMMYTHSGTNDKTETETENMDEIMTQVILSLNKNKVRFIEQYEKLHGYGAYDSVYTSSPIMFEDSDDECENGVENGEVEVMEDIFQDKAATATLVQ